MIKPVFKDNLIVVRGAGDIASGAIYALYKAGFPVIILDIANPSAIRRKVAFCEAVFDGKCTLEGVTCTLVKSVQEARDLALNGELPLLIDEEAEVEILYRKKNFDVGKIKKITKFSPYRINPLCKCATSCGGCSFQNLDPCAPI